MELLLPTLEYEYDVDYLVMESREPHQDSKDLTFIQGIRSRHIINRIRVDFEPGDSDARLWIPDQILGAIGDTRNGNIDFSEMIEALDFRTVNLHDT